MHESPSSGGISVHRQSCSKYKEHMLTVWKLKNQAVALRRGKYNTTKDLGQTPDHASDCQRHEPECSMEILDDLVSLHISTGSADCSEYRLNSHIHLPVALSLPQWLYLLHHHLFCYISQASSLMQSPDLHHHHLLHILYQPCLRVHHNCLHHHLLLTAYLCCHCHCHLQPLHNQVVRFGSVVCQQGIRTYILNCHTLFLQHHLLILLHPSLHLLRQRLSCVSSGLLYGINSEQAQTLLGFGRTIDIALRKTLTPL